MTFNLHSERSKPTIEARVRTITSVGLDSKRTQTAEIERPCFGLAAERHATRPIAAQSGAQSALARPAERAAWPLS